MPRRPCLVCGRPAEGSYCAVHKPDDNARRNAKTVAHGVKRAHFQLLRAQARDLAGGLCELRLPGCTTIGTTAHLDPALEGDHDAATIDDVKWACSHCHGVEDGRRSIEGTRV